MVELRFDSTTSQLAGLSGNDVIILAPSALLPTGYQASVLSVFNDASDLIVRVGLSERVTGDSAQANGIVSAYLPPPTTLVDSNVCSLSAPPEDEDSDGVLDRGVAELQCNGVSGGDYGFEVELADGVIVNGLLSAAPFDMNGVIEFDQGSFVEASFINTGRLSFTGELSATQAAELGNQNYVLGQVPIASYFVEVAELGSFSVDLVATMFVGACGSVAAGARTGLVSTAVADLGIELTAENGPQLVASTADPDIKVSPPKLDTDTAADVTLYGGAALRMNVTYITGGIPIPLSRAQTTMTFRGSVHAEIDPQADPWWRVSGRPEVFVDVIPELLGIGLDEFSFEIVNPEPTTFFTSDDEFPFDATISGATRGDNRTAGSALHWSRAYSTTDDYGATDVVPTADGGALISAASTAFGLLIRTDLEGNRLWQRRFTGGYVIRAVQTLVDDTILVGGERDSGLWMARLSSDGNILWSHVFVPTGVEFNTVHFGNVGPGGLLIGGTLVDSALELSPYALSIQTDGQVNWARRYGQVAIDETIEGVSGTNDNGLLLVGQTQYTPEGPLLPGSNAYVLKLADDGMQDWSYVWASSNFERLLGATQSPAGAYYAVGEKGGTNQDASPRGLVIRLDEASITGLQAARWVRTVGGSLSTSDLVFDRLNAVTADEKGLHVAGTSRLGADSTMWLARLAESNDKPDLVWSVFHDGGDADNAIALHDIGDGLLIGGDSASFAVPERPNSLWLTRAPYDGLLNWNASSNASGAYTALKIDEPPSFPSFLTDLNRTGEEVTTSLESTSDLTVTIEPASGLLLATVPIASQELVKAPLPFVDSDADGIADELDNCLVDSNPDQRDTDGDGYGNICDADLNNDNTVNVVDLGIFRSVFFTGDADADFDGDGVVNFIDLGVLRLRLFEPPGPSGLNP
ncbi:MAG: thrombospondin type 3 repeat-containing protein [Pseudomonadota bacterium]